MIHVISPQAGEFLGRMQKALAEILGEKLLGLYLYGSLAAGDFLAGISDIDLFALLAGDLTQNEFDRLDKAHLEIIAENPLWENRIEIAYLSRAALEAFRTRVGRIAVISPGEPFHFKDAGMDWAINWYILRQQGKVLYGPPLQEVFPEISPSEFVSIVRQQAGEWGDYIVNTRDSTRYQAYAVVTLCRAYFAAATGVQPTKPQAAAWARRQFPQWTALIDWSLEMRAVSDELVPDPSLSYPQVAAFVRFIIDEIQALPV